MKNWICYLSLLFLVACDKGDDLPAWDKSMTFDQIERYETLRQRIDEKALLSTLTSSVFEALVLNEHRDGEWVYADELLTGKSYAQQFLFESDSTWTTRLSTGRSHTNGLTIPDGKRSC